MDEIIMENANDITEIVEDHVPEIITPARSGKGGIIKCLVCFAAGVATPFAVKGIKKIATKVRPAKKYVKLPATGEKVLVEVDGKEEEATVVQ